MMPAQEITDDQFRVVADLLRAKEPVRSAVKRVMVDAMAVKKAAESTGLSPAVVSNVLRSFRKLHAKLCFAYPVH